MGHQEQTLRRLTGRPEGVRTGTCSSDAVTINSGLCLITTEAKTTAAAGTYTITLTNAAIDTGAVVLVNVAINSGGAGVPVVTSVLPASGSCTIVVQNNHASAAFDGAHKLMVAVLNPPL